MLLPIPHASALALSTTLYYAADLSDTALNVSLSSALFGMCFAIFEVVRMSVHSTASRHPDLPCCHRSHHPDVRCPMNWLAICLLLLTYNIRRRGLCHKSVKLLLAATLLLYGSTTIYMASLANYLASVHRLVSRSNLTMPSSFANDDIRTFKADILRQSWMMTISLAINVGYFSDFSKYFRPDLHNQQMGIGDIVVWWRACSVWRSRWVYALGAVFMALTLSTYYRLN